jgi:integration host factor subunit alpha
MAAVTKAEIIEHLFNVVGLNKNEAREIVETLFDEICFSLREGFNVKIPGLGNFNLRDKNERPGRNPKTGKMVPITPRRVVTFHAGQKFKNRIAQYAGSRKQTETAA